MTEEAQLDHTEIISLPGIRLKNARESKGLEQIDIARELKLDQGLIEALEQGDMDKLPQPVYTAGYIRSYARLMDLPADNMVADYVAQKTKDLPKLPTEVNKLPDRYRRVAEALPRSFSIAAANSQNNPAVQYAVLGIGVFLVVLVAWQSSRMLSEEGSETPSTELVVSLSPEESADLAQSQQQAALDPTSSTSTESSQSNKTNQKVATIQDNSAAAQGKNTSSAQQSPTGTQSNGTTLPSKNAENQPVEEKIADGAEESRGEAFALLEKQNATDLLLTFNKNSWVDIRDATGKRLIRKLGIAGNSQKVTGMAPFQVLLGYGHGVSIEYNGKEVDFSAFQGDSVARFTLEVPKRLEQN